MFASRLAAALERRSSLAAASAASLALALGFIFVWAPHPWGREGFDHYHDLALAIAAGHPFPTMDQPWGYAYFLAAFYRAFGDRPWIPLVAQALLNATIPLLVFDAARRWFDVRTATLAALITGVCSFNTVYASTQSSDSVCTWLFMAAVCAFLRALDRRDRRWYALAGALAGLASQFRPNLLLIPAVFAAFAVARRRTRRAAVNAVLLLACAASTLAPWIVRNYRLTGLFVPTSVHAGMQLWYGSLQVGPYLTSRAYNPRSVFEAAVFEYSSLDRVPLIVEADTKDCPAGRLAGASVVFWTDRDRAKREISGTIGDRVVSFAIPPSPAPTVVYYYLRTRWLTADGPVSADTPIDGEAAPFVYFVSTNHLGDLDAHDDVLDMFDLIRAVRHRAWGEAPAAAEVEEIADALTRRFDPRRSTAAVQSLVSDARSARLTFVDGSSLVVPRDWRGRITDVAIDGALATDAMSSTVRRAISSAGSSAAVAPPPACSGVEHVRVNDVFYRREPHMARRYMALALDNIDRDPDGFAFASLYRALRVFVVSGTADPRTAQQFRASRAVYAAATIASAIYIALFIAGAVAAWRRGARIGLPLLLIAYVPATIAPMLTNMRYSVTVQPLIFVFIACAVTTRLHVAPREAAEAPQRAGS